VKDSLTGTLVAIHYCSETIFGDALCRRYFTRCGVQTADKRLIFFRNIVDRRDVFSRDNQHVCWCLWIDVAECDRRFGFIDNIRRNIAAQNFAKQTI